MLRVRDLMSSEVETLEPNDDIDLASMLMRLDRLRHLPVVDEDGIVGIVSDRDVLRAQQSVLGDGDHDARRRFAMSIKAGDVMTPNVDTISPDASALEAAQVLREKGYGCLPVVDDGKLVGIVTPTDFLGLVVEMLLA